MLNFLLDVFIQMIIMMTKRVLLKSLFQIMKNMYMHDEKTYMSNKNINVIKSIKIKINGSVLGVAILVTICIHIRTRQKSVELLISVVVVFINY